MTPGHPGWSTGGSWVWEALALKAEPHSLSLEPGGLGALGACHRPRPLPRLLRLPPLPAPGSQVARPSGGTAVSSLPSCCPASSCSVSPPRGPWVPTSAGRGRGPMSRVCLPLSPCGALSALPTFVVCRGPLRKPRAQGRGLRDSSDQRPDVPRTRVLVHGHGGVWVPSPSVFRSPGPPVAACGRALCSDFGPTLCPAWGTAR